MDAGIEITTINFETKEQKQEVFKSQNTTRNLMSSVAKYTNHTSSYNPNENLISTYKIIGDDNRAWVSNTAAYPYSK